MGLRNLLKKKGGVGGGDGSDNDDDDGDGHGPGGAAASRQPPPAPLQTPEFTFIRSDTHSQEVIHPPSGPRSYFDDDDDDDSSQGGQHLRAVEGAGGGPSSAPRTNRRSFDVFKKSGRSSRSTSVSSSTGAGGDHHRDVAVESAARRLSNRLHLSRTPSTSSHVPPDLPEIVVPEGEGDGGNKSAKAVTAAAAAAAAAVASPAAAASSGSATTRSADDPAGAVESQWEKRATMLALHSSSSNSRPTTPERRLDSRGRSSGSGSGSGSGNAGGGDNGRSRSNSAVSNKEVDATIQEAIRLHEDGQLEQSTRMFGILADPRGYNNPLSQVLYGLALRHGWGCTPDTEAAVRYLSAAASNAAAIEQLALQAGLNKGGAAKGELVLAIFELANCFRHGWGLEKDPIAAKQYYETAANLGDTDAMNEVAWCYLEGFGCKKDKFAAARYYRLAEQKGNKTIGNTWIWKDKYDPDKQKKK